MKYNSRSNQSSYPITLIKAMGYSILSTLILIVILAIVLTFTSLSEDVIPFISSIIMIISIVLGGIYISFKSERLGWLNGAVVGLVYILFVVIIGSSVFSTFKMDLYMIFRMIIALITGAVAGMIGINLR